jgi:hypothetical protein
MTLYKFAYHFIVVKCPGAIVLPFRLLLFQVNTFWKCTTMPAAAQAGMFVRRLVTLIIEQSLFNDNSV